MQTARRLYVYLLSGISLGVLVAGVSMLLSVLFDRLGLGLTGAELGGADIGGQRLTLALALTVVSLPVWLVHWLAAERSLRNDPSDRPVERSSSVRGLYFALAMGLLLLAAGSGLSGVIQATVMRIVDDQRFGGDIAGGLGLAIAAGAAWAYHVRVRTRDWAIGPLRDGGAWLPRTYLYLAAFIGLLVMLGGIGGALELVGRLIIDEPLFGDPSETWWAYPLATSLASLVVGAAVWIGHFWYANTILRDPGWRGDAERTARLRLAYFVAALVATAAGAVYLVADSARAAIAGVLGVSEADGAAQLLGLVLLPLITAAAYAVAWWFHRRWMEAEAERSGSGERVESEHRLELYPMALVGLAFGAVGTAWLIGLLLQSLLGTGRTLSGTEVTFGELARWVPIAVLGAGVWLWWWRGAELRRSVDPVGEASSATRRTMLLLVLGVSLLAGIAAAGLILYRLFGSLLGVDQPGDPVAELSTPIGVLLVAIAVAGYHALQLRRDQGLRVEQAVATQQTRTTHALRLVAPTNADVGSVVAALRGQLPVGYVLELDEPAPPGAG
jgi:hypothetical protein